MTIIFSFQPKMTDEDWCQEKLANLQIKDLRMETLNEIKNKLIQSNDISANFSSALLDCMEDSNKWVHLKEVTLRGLAKEKKL